MTATDFMAEFERLPPPGQARVAEHVARRFSARPGLDATPHLRPKPFGAAMDRVFRGSGELLRRRPAQ